MGYSIKRLKPAKQHATPDMAERAELSLLPLLHAVDPYEDFDHTAYPNDPVGWGSDSTAFEKLIANAQHIELIVEVGTWKGGSAITMAKALQAHNSSATILCIDTWLGALEFWQNHQDSARYGSLNLKNGYPSVYYQFLANVCYAGHQARIVPFPQTSATAALFLRTHGIQSSLIYIDGSHEEEDVYQDLFDYWPILSSGGIIFGDDYTWDGVRLAVSRFAKEKRLQIAFEADKWMLTKT
ncbi:MAG: putative O-methyltransferase YrrM [Verrucomicrobiales bacterium]|jgi:predicted O-methyltransferase YrrM